MLSASYSSVAFTQSGTSKGDMKISVDVCGRLVSFIVPEMVHEPMHFQMPEPPMSPSSSLPVVGRSIEPSPQISSAMASKLSGHQGNSSQP